MTPTLCPLTSILPVRSAATAVAPLGSATIFTRSNKRRMAVLMSACRWNRRCPRPCGLSVFQMSSELILKCARDSQKLCVESSLTNHRNAHRQPSRRHLDTDCRVSGRVASGIVLQFSRFYSPQNPSKLETFVPSTSGVSMFRDIVDTSRDRWWENCGLNRCPISVSRPLASILSWFWALNGRLRRYFCEKMALSTCERAGQKLAYTRNYEAPPTGFEPVPPP